MARRGVQARLFSRSGCVSSSKPPDKFHLGPAGIFDGLLQASWLILWHMSSVRACKALRERNMHVILLSLAVLHSLSLVACSQR